MKQMYNFLFSNHLLRFHKYCPYIIMSSQTMPLDLLTSDFYTNRKDEIDERVDWLSRASPADLIGVLRTVWEKHEGTMVTGISWER